MVDIGSTLKGLDRATGANHSKSVAFVGMNPSVKGTSKGSTFDRLNDWVNRLGLESVGFMNVWPHPGKCKVSQVNLDNLRKALYNVTKVVALGNFASEALTKAGIDHFKLPHPSPLNRQINDVSFITQCLKECRSYLDG